VLEAIGQLGHVLWLFSVYRKFSGGDNSELFMPEDLFFPQIWCCTAG